MHIRISVYAALVLLVTGCSSTNLSKRDPFCDYVGRTVELRRPVVVVERPRPFGGDVFASRYTKYGLMDPGPQPTQMHGDLATLYPKLTEVPVGHRVQIDSVWDEVQSDPDQIVAYGRTTIPPSSNEVQFPYSWGQFWILKRAPWDRGETPSSR